MADDVAELAPLGPQHAQRPARLAGDIDQVGQRHLGWRRQAVFEVLVALSEYLKVERDHQCRAMGRLGPVDQALNEAAVFHHIQLKPKWVAAGGLGDVFDRADAHGGQGERNAKFFGRQCPQNLAIGMLHASQAGGRNRHWHRHRLADHGAGGAAVFHIDRYTLAQLDALEVALVGSVG